VDAAPVIIDNDSDGSWSDSFEDMTGIESWDNVQQNAGDVELSYTTPILYEVFSGTNGAPPDNNMWDTFEDGFTLEIENNQLNSSVTSKDGIWKDEMIQTKDSFHLNHNLTWRQQLHKNSVSRMYYHFYIINSSDDSWIFGLDQNDKNDYQYQNFEAGTHKNFTSNVSGWHDFKVTYVDSYVKFYFDGSLEFEYDFNVDSVKYRFGTHCLNTQPTDYESNIYTDDIFINSSYGIINSTEIVLPDGQTWDSLNINKLEAPINSINVSVLDGATYQPILGYENLDGNIIDISGIDYIAHPSIRLSAEFFGDGSSSPALQDWQVIWKDTIPPEAPTGLRIDNLWTGNSLDLHWDQNLETDVDIYSLWYSTDNIIFNLVVNLPSDTLSFTHGGLTQGTTYYYEISANDEVPNQSPFSDVVLGVPDKDMDGDGIGDNADLDIDGDTVLNEDDAFWMNPLEWMDTDSDGVGNNADFDDDNDGYKDSIDDFPLDPSEWNDFDNDTIGDNTDDDIDGDGVKNSLDAFEFNKDEWSDFDGDGIGDNIDPDDDNDYYFDINDDFPFNPMEWRDLDRDGLGDNTDEDIDGDNYNNTMDAFIHNPYEWFDTDSDGIGNNNDSDDDNDGFSDETELLMGTDPLDRFSFPKEAERDEEPGFLEDDKTKSAALGIAAGAATAGIIISSEFLFFALMSIFAPLLIRLRRKDLLENEIRGMIRAYIRIHPGAHYSAIKSGLSLPNGSLIYHLNKLEKKRIIYSKRDGRFKRFYPKGIQPDEKPILTEFQDDLLETINDTPGVSKAELAYLFERNRQDINHNVNVLKDKGLIRTHKNNGNVFLFIKDGEIEENEKAGYDGIIGIDENEDLKNQRDDEDKDHTEKDEENLEDQKKS
jgi:predicted transcriptional regulator